jgi:hypothetical protein
MQKVCFRSEETNDWTRLLVLQHCVMPLRRKLGAVMFGSDTSEAFHGPEK